jgi:hypothetical protein
MNKNTKRKLENLAAFIEKLPRKAFNINIWAKNNKRHFDSDGKIVPRNIVSKKDLNNLEECGTTCCIAGWQVVRKGFSVTNLGTVSKGGKFINSAPILAAEQLGLNLDESSALFYPRESKLRVLTGKTFTNTPKGAAKRIRYFIKNGI